MANQVERETNALVGGANVSSERVGGGPGASMGAGGGPTVAVVNIVLALRGDALKKQGLDRSVNSMSGAVRDMGACGCWHVAVFFVAWRNSTIPILGSDILQNVQQCMVVR